MFCWYCGSDFEPYDPGYGWIQESFCKHCYGQYRQGRQSPSKSNRHCIECGSEIHGWLVKTKRGFSWRTKGSGKGVYFCSNCTQKRMPTKERYCDICSSALKGKAHKYCDDHKPLKSSNHHSHKKHALEWQKRNPKKTQCAYKSRYFSHKVNVVYECRCESDKKHNHHFDYSRPFEVIRLCPSCHSAEHKRIKNISAKAEAA